MKRSLVAGAALVLIVALLGYYFTRPHNAHKSSGIPPSTTSVPPSAGGVPPSATSISSGVYIADFFKSPSAKSVASTLNDASIDGYSQTYKWSDIDPNTPDSPNFSRLDADIRAVAAHGKHLALGIDTGEFTPAWAYGNDPHNAVTVTIVAHNGKLSSRAQCHDITVPIPWNATYQSNLRTFLHQLASHIYSDTTLSRTVTQIKLTGITESTEETRMPAQYGAQCTNSSGQVQQVSDALTAWNNVGYTRPLVESAWEAIATEWASAFPDKTLAMPIIPSGGFPAVNSNGTVILPQNGVAPPTDTQTTDDLVAWAAKHFGRRFMVMHNSLGADSNESISATAYREGASIGFQLADVTFGQSHSTPSSSFSDAITNGLTSHMSYLEIFPIDPSLYAGALVSAHSSLR